MRVKNWDYRELRERIADGLTLRRFTDFNAQPCLAVRQIRRGLRGACAFSERAFDELSNHEDLSEATGRPIGARNRVGLTCVALSLPFDLTQTALF
jgi:IS5 family transposase